MSSTGKLQGEGGSRASSPGGLNWSNLIQSQRRGLEAIKTIKSNFKKDGPSRRTLEYLNKRLDALEVHWVDFEANNDLLLQMEDKENEYFREDVFNKTKGMYDAVKQEIMASRLQLSLGMQQGSSRGTEGAPPFLESDLIKLIKNQADNTNESGGGLNQENKNLLRQQLLNFNALERAISKINLFDMDEKWELEDCLNTLKIRWSAIDKIHWELSFGLGGSIATYDKEYLKWEDTYETLKKNISRKIWANAHYRKATPQVDLPDFDGNYNKWVSFRDLFTETVHNNPLLSKSQRMQHLKSKLKGEAEKLIQHLAISAENYDSCWEIMKHRYENKRLLFSSYANTLLGLTTIQQPNASNIKKMHDTIKECVNGLTNLGVDISTWDPLLVHLLLPKLDTTTYNEYTHGLEHPRELPKLQELTDFLEAKFIAFESIKQNQGQHSTYKQEILPRKQGPWQHKPMQKHYYFQNKFNETRPSNYKKPEMCTKSFHTTYKTCPLCKKGHVLMYCGLFLNMDVATRNENYLLQLVKNQTSIMETENNIIKRNENFMKNQLQSIHSYIEMTNNTFEKIVYKVETMSTMNDLNAACLTASLILWNLKQTQDTLLNTLTNIHNGHLDIHLLTPKQLVQQMNMIAARISKRLTLPVKNIEDDIKDVYKLLYVRARVTSSYLLLEVHLPLMSEDEYNIYKILPLLMYGPNKEAVSVKPTTTHIAVNFGKETYITVDEMDLRQCTKLKENNLICNRNYPIYNLRNENAPCEAEILSQQTSSHCHLTKVKCSDGWVELHKRNRWLYLCCSTCHARLLCDDQITSIKISNVGIIDLNEGCILQKKDTTLYAYNHFGSTVELEPVVPDIPDVNLHLNEDFNFNLSSIPLPSITFNQTEEHRKLEKELQLQKYNEKLPAAEISPHDIHQYSVLYVLVAAFCLAATYILVKHCKKRHAERTEPQEPKVPPKKPKRNPAIRSQEEIRQWVEQGSSPDQEAQRPPQRMFNFDKN